MKCVFFDLCSHGCNVNLHIPVLYDVYGHPMCLSRVTFRMRSVYYSVQSKEVEVGREGRERDLKA